MKNNFGFTNAERRIFSRLDTPAKIQDFIDRLEYNLEEHGDTCFSPRKVLRFGKANCIEGAIFAAAALRFNGHKPLIMDLTSVRDDDHVIAIFRQHGHWGSIAKSKYTGLAYREPVHRSLRELAVSYFEGYFNFDGEKTLRGHSLPVDMSKFDRLEWMTSEKDLHFVSDHLNSISHKHILRPSMIRGLRPVTSHMLEAGELWMRKNNLREKAKKLSS